MVFQVGNYYRHTGGVMLSIISEVTTTLYGSGLLAEDGQGNLRIVGKDEVSAQNWQQSTYEEWMKNFSK